MLALWQDNVGVRNGTQCAVMAELAHAPQPPQGRSEAERGGKQPVKRTSEAAANSLETARKGVLPRDALGAGLDSQPQETARM